MRHHHAHGKWEVYLGVLVIHYFGGLAWLVLFLFRSWLLTSAVLQDPDSSTDKRLLNMSGTWHKFPRHGALPQLCCCRCCSCCWYDCYCCCWCDRCCCFSPIAERQTAAPIAYCFAPLGISSS
ncbi:unnamed protein product [Polarella glacialis]|uniref:Uncharacterized protein n=1 Tax=Polarella glacialis TaxID=89957 RepID=A0A813JHE6_POLGL|nr:unnamed protein product [Polarella glacialis]